MTPSISETDILHLSMLRQNVLEFMIRTGNQYDSNGIKILDIAPQDHAGAAPHFPRSVVETLDIDPDSGATYIADLCQDNTDSVPSDHFDIVVCTEVLEHTLNPFKAVSEIRRVLKPSGVSLVSVPFNFRIHGPLPDCWRFTEHGLRSLFSGDSGFEIVELTPLEDPLRFLMPIHYTLIARRIM